MQVCRGGKREEKYFLTIQEFEMRFLQRPSEDSVFWDVTLRRWLFTGASKMCNISFFKGSFETSGKHPMSQHHILISGTLSPQRYQILTERCCRSFT